MRREPGTVQPDQITTTFGVRLLERKLTMSVRWQAVAAKPASETPDRNKNGLPDFAPVDAYNLVNLYIGYRRRRLFLRASASIMCSTSTPCGT